jgi:magnesium transporter
MARAPIDDPALLLYRIIDALVDSFFPILADFDDRIEELENQTFLHASRQAAAGDLRHEAAARRYAEAVTPQRDLFCQSDGRCRRAARDDNRGGGDFRDVYDHLIQRSD